MLNINNPGNIRKDGQHWQGETEPSTNASFKQFDTMAWGYRAMFILLRTYIKNKTNTIRKIISKYAPPNENNTTTYINNVTLWTSIPADQVLTLNDGDLLIKLVAAISRMENGKQAVMSDVLAGFNLQDSIKKK